LITLDERLQLKYEIATTGKIELKRKNSSNPFHI
jgi:hypothetical protein